MRGLTLILVCERQAATPKIQGMPPTQTKMREKQRNAIDGELSLTLNK